jgi:hypothetical protein
LGIGWQGKTIITNSIGRGINNASSVTYNPLTYDSDSDGIADQVEDSLAPNGDGNGDGIRDKLQSGSCIFPGLIEKPVKLDGTLSTLNVSVVLID